MKNKFRFHLFLLALFSGYHCTNQQKLMQSPKGHTPQATALKQSIPVQNPWVYFGHFPYITSDGTLSTAKNVQDLKHDATLLNSLCAWQETITVLDVTGAVTVTVPIVNAGVNGEKYSVIYEFKKYTNVDTANSRLSVGIEVRLVANFTTLKGSVNLSLTGLGASASAGKITGTISTSLYGASLSKICESFTTTSSITAETIEKILQQVATLKSTVFDPNTIICPYVLDIEQLGTADATDWKQAQEQAKALSPGFTSKK